jgi:hypothetical protein
VRPDGAGNRKTGSTCDSRQGHAMFKLKSIPSMFLSTFGPATPLPDLEAVRRLCLASLTDVPRADQASLLHRLDRMRRASDVPDLRCALFDVVSRFHGEAIARERIDALDGELR